MGLRAIVNVPSYLQGSPPPALDTPWLPRGAQPLPNPLSSTATVDPSLVKQLVDAGWTMSSWTTG
jgi:hypothetical protein